MDLDNRPDYSRLLAQIGNAFADGRIQAVREVNRALLATYWQVGRHIVEFEQDGQVRAEYGKALIEQLARDLTLRHGKGFGRSNLIRIRQFYLLYPKGATLSHQLSWSHVVELLKIDDPLERSFYEQQSVTEKWSVRELIRQKESALFLRLAASRDKAGILKLASEGQVVEQPADLLREPYVFEFLKISEPWQVSETQLETLLCDHLQQFLLELGKGFTYVGRQYRITLNNRHKVDLVFYHRILRCFVLIDLKLGEVQHQDIGQMNMDELLVEYATYNLNSQLFVQKYQLYLPEREELRRELESTLREAGE
ncbi:MAG: DUF1016 family protein [Variovorax sp.]|nr:MAG: DUF1016 family protein [Variovorax sp.]